MKVYFDITELLKQNKVTGIQRVVIEQIKALYKEGIELVLLSADMDSGDRYIFNQCDISVFMNYYVDKKISKKDKIVTRNKIPVEDMIYGDVFLDVDLPLGSFNRNELFKILSSNGVIIIPFIHDLIPLLFPQTCDDTLVRLFRGYIEAVVKYSDYILVNSENTKNDIESYINKNNLRKNKFVVSILGSDYTMNDVNEVGINDKIKEIANGDKYLLSVGTIEPRKNHAYSLEAFDKALFDEGVNYVIVGKKGWKVDELYDKLINHPQYNKSLFILENVSDYELDYLYKNAYFSLFPSFYEGFGLPIVESIQRGTPVLTTDIAVMREVGKESAEYFDLDDTNTLIEIVRSYLNDENKYLELKTKVNNHHVVTWEESVQVIINLINNIDVEPRIEIDAIDGKQFNDIYSNIEKNANKIRRNQDEFLSMIGANSMSNNLNYEITDEYLYQANLNSHVTSYYELKTDRKFGKLIIFGKRVLRKLNKSIVEVPLEKQSRFNSSVTNYLGEVNKIIKDDSTEVQVSNLNTQVSNLNTQVSNLDTQVSNLDTQVSNLDTQVSNLDTQATNSDTKISNLETQISELMDMVKALNLECIKRDEYERLCENVRNNNAILKNLSYSSNGIADDNGFTSFSQAGEDMVIRYICRALDIYEGTLTYIDIGANDPKVNSNTYYFYAKGSRGVLVEPNKDLLPKLSEERPEDTLINYCVDLEDGKIVELFKANFDGGLSTINADIRESVLKENDEIKFEIDAEVKTITVNTIIEDILKTVPDIVSIDVEGNEIRVLESIDFSKYRPKIFVIEVINYSKTITNNTKNADILKFMEEKGYKEYCFTGINSIFIDGNLER